MNQSQCFNPSCLHLNPPGENICQLCGANLSLRSRYQAFKIIGQKKFSVTFLAVDEQQSPPITCVIKQFLPQGVGSNSLQQASELLEREGAILKQLGNHPQIPELLDYFLEDEKLYLVYEFIEGQTLREALPGNKVLNQQQISKILVNLLAVLKFVHKRQIIHGDINPENIIIRKSDNKILLVGFGIGNLTASILAIGAEPYTAPEQKKGQPAFASDLYGLGVTCLYLLTKVEPVQLFDPNKFTWLWRKYLVINPVSEPLSIILDKLIKIDLTQRFNSVNEVLLDLKEIGIEPEKDSDNLTQKNPTQSGFSLANKLKNLLFTEINTSGVKVPGFASKNKNTNLDSGDDNFSKLRNFLTEEKWKEADQETWRLIAILGEGEQQESLNPEAMISFPCEDLMIIDKLWIENSQGRFGFTVQNNIYKKLAGNEEFNSRIWQAFGDRVGWRGRGYWLNYFDLKFDINAPEGHLPVEPVKVNLGGSFSTFIKRGILQVSIFSRLDFCQR